MDELLKKANIPDDGSMYIGELIDEPFLGKMTFCNDFSISDYSLHTRLLWSCGYKVIGGNGEIVLDSAERIPVRVIASANIIPTPHAVRTGRWIPRDDYFSIRDTDLTPEQAKRACYFVQPLTEMGL
jgi:hypothetical protein